MLSLLHTEVNAGMRSNPGGPTELEERPVLWSAQSTISNPLLHHPAQHGHMTFFKHSDWCFLMSAPGSLLPAFSELPENHFLYISKLYKLFILFVQFGAKSLNLMQK